MLLGLNLVWDVKCNKTAYGSKRNFWWCFLTFYCSFVCFCRIAAGLLTILISFFSLTSLCKSENKYRNNEDLKIYFYQVSCYFSIILNVRGFLCANFYLPSKNTFLLPRPQFSRKKRLFLRVFSWLFQEDHVHIFKYHHAVFPKTHCVHNYIAWYINVHIDFDALLEESVLPLVCVYHFQWPLQ